jgi:Spy/CpxP family protein refolding chaperone
MKSIRTTLYAVTLTAALGGGAAIAGTTPTPPSSTSNDASSHPSMRHDWHGEHQDGDFHRVLGQLNLTAEQKTQIHAIVDQAKPQMQAVHESGRANREQLAVTPPTDAAYAGLVATAKSNAAEQIQLMSDLWTQVYAKLTPEQRAQIPSIVAAQRADWDARKDAWKQQHSKQDSGAGLHQ